jgi:hypothetical protein
MAECLICKHLLCNKSMKPWVQTPVPLNKQQTMGYGYLQKKILNYIQVIDWN